MISVGDENNIDDLAKELGCKTEKILFTYLGMPIGYHWRCTSVWEKVLRRLEPRLSTWKKKTLNKAGRLTLIKHCLSSLHIYFLSLFHLLVSVEKKLIKLIRNFLWGAAEGRRKIV